MHVRLRHSGGLVYSRGSSRTDDRHVKQALLAHHQHDNHDQEHADAPGSDLLEANAIDKNKDENDNKPLQFPTVPSKYGAWVTTPASSGSLWKGRCWTMVAT